MRIIFVLTAIVFIAGVAPLEAADVVDKFGQGVPKHLDAVVTEARKNRLNPGSGNLSESITELERVVEEKNDYFRAWFNLGLAYWQASSENDLYEKSKRAFDHAIDIRDREKISDISVFNSAGWVSMRAGDYNSAGEISASRPAGYRAGWRIHAGGYLLESWAAVLLRAKVR